MELRGLLGADTINREDYYLNNKENQNLFENDYYYDSDINICIYNTDLRIESMELFIFEEDCLQDDTLVVFTHEWKLNLINKLKIYFLMDILDSNNVEYSFL